MIQIDGEKALFSPGETIQGTVSWEAEKIPRRVELRLFWYTTGRGTQDVGIIEVQQLPPSPPANPIPFTFALPAGPYSFTGTLITLGWAIELVSHPGSRAQRLEFSMSPQGKPIALAEASDEPVRPALFTG
jgi:hypothetical protein